VSDTDFGSSLTTLSIFVGFFSFLILIFQTIYLAIKKEWKDIKSAIKTTSIIIFIFITSLVAFLLFPNVFSNNEDEQVGNSFEEIECFVDGVSVKTTRENCQKLSIKEDNVQPVQVIQQRKIEIPDPPKVQIPKTERTNCNAKYDILGNYSGMDCTTY